LVEIPRAPVRERRYALLINEPQPLKTVSTIWRSFVPAATVGIFLLLAVAALYLGRTFFTPVAAALVVGMTLAPLVKLGARQGVSPWISGPALVLLVLAVVAAGLTLIAAPVSEWITRAPEIGATVREKLYILDRPLAALREMQEALLPKGEGALKVEAADSNILMPIVAMLTPAIGEIIIFIGVLTFYLVGQIELRKQFVKFFASRDAKLRFLKIVNDIEKNLTSYLAVMTAINAALGTLVALGAWLFGLPNPIIFGLLAAVLNYVPYIGAAVMLVVLFAVGLVTFPTLGYAILPPLSFLALTTLEGQFVTPTIMGARLTLSPLTVFLALAFWTWMWGPIGAFLAVPLAIVGVVITAHLVPDGGKLPG
jgi:predicted PurR-regulated permease PerM